MLGVKKVYGPYSEKDGRKTVIIHFEDGSKRKTAYARHLWEMNYGPVPEGMEVDHKDEDHTNDSLDNLQLLTELENKQKHMRTKAPKLLTLTCLACSATFERTARVEKERLRRKFTGPFCTKKCSGSYGRKVQIEGAIAAYEPVLKTGVTCER